MSRIKGGITVNPAFISPLTACHLFLPKRGRAIATTATTGSILPVEHTVDHRGGTSNASIYRDSTGQTVLAAGPAFNTGVPYLYAGTSSIHFKYPMGTDLKTHTATGASIAIQLQGDYIP